MSWPGIELDVLGDFAVVNVDRSVYSDTAVFKTAYWFTDRFYVFLDRGDRGCLRIELRSKAPLERSALQAALAEFCNAALDNRVREQVLKETSGVREALVLKAFSEGVPRSGLPGVISNEANIANKRPGER